MASAAPEGSSIGFYEHTLEREENRYYQAGLLEAEDLWLWDLLLAPTSNRYPFVLSGLARSEGARLEVVLQGVSDLPEFPDHHLRVSVNGTQVAESTLEGKRGLRLTAEIPAGVVREGENELEIENLGDTGAAYSMVMLDRFSVRYPRALAGMTLEGSFHESGVAEVSGLPGGAWVVELGNEPPRWLRGMESSATGVRFRAEPVEISGGKPAGGGEARGAEPSSEPSEERQESDGLSGHRTETSPRDRETADRSAPTTGASKPECFDRTGVLRFRLWRREPEAIREFIATPIITGESRRRATSCCWAMPATTSRTTWEPA